MRKPKSTAAAHELLIEAEITRIAVEDGTTPWANRRFELARADDLEQTARELLALEAPAEVGTGGEIVPQGRDAIDYPGIACMVRERDLTAAHASRDRLRLADEARCFDLAADMAESAGARNSVEKALLHQMAAAHATAMTLLGRAQEELRANDRTDGRGQRLGNLEAVRLGNAAARLMGAFGEGLVALHRSRSGGQQIVQVVHQHVDARGGRDGGGGSRENKKGHD